MLSDKVDQDDSLKSEEDPARQSFWWKQTLDQKNSSKKSEYWVLIELRFSQEMIDRACLLPPPEPSKIPLDRQTVSQTDRQSYRSVRLIYHNMYIQFWLNWGFPMWWFTNLSGKGGYQARFSIMQQIPCFWVDNMGGVPSFSLVY